MDRSDEHKYYVVKFLENPFKDIERISCELFCVPKSWCEWNSREDNIVRVWYPTQHPWNTEKRVRKREKKSDQWVSVLAVLKYSNDFYEDANIYIQRKKNSDTKNKEDRTPLSAMVEEETSKTTSSVHKNEATVNNMLDTSGYSKSSKSANTIPVKRRAPADSDKTAYRKRSRVNEPGESVDEVAGPSSQAFESSRNNQTHLIHKKSNDRNSTENKQTEKQNDSKANHSLDPKSVDQLLAEKSWKLMEELQKYLGTSLVQEIFNKIMKTDNNRSAPTSTSRDNIVQAPKLNEEKRNEEQTAENDSDDDGCGDNDCDVDDCGDDDCDAVDGGDDINKHTKTKTTPVPIINEVVPPKYDAKESEDNDEHVHFYFNNILHGTKRPPQTKKVPPKYDDAPGSKEDDLDDCGDDINKHTKTKTNTVPTIKEVVPPKYDAKESEDNDEHVHFYFNNILHGTKRPPQTKKVPPKYDDATGSKEDDLNNGGDDDERKTSKRKPSLPYLKQRPRRLKNFVLPPEYDANDSRWTLKYREPAPGLVELIEHSGVYVNASRLTDCINSENHSDLLGQLLLSEVFTSNALSTCSWTGRRASGIYSYGTNARPGLDEHAREVLLKFLEVHEGDRYHVKHRDDNIHKMNRKMLDIRRNASKKS